MVCFGASGLVAGSERNLLAATKTAVQMPWFSIVWQMSASKAVIGLNVLTLWDEPTQATSTRRRSKRWRPRAVIHVSETSRREAGSS